ncbi:MAG TPA: amino acid permease [Polyangia bacterium]|jgi:amino acid transporter
MGWLGATALAMGGSNQSLFLIGALMMGEGSIRGQGTAAVPLLIFGLVLSWLAMPGWTELVLMWPDRVGGIAATCGEAFRPYAPVLGNLTGVSYWWGWVPTCGLTALLSGSAIHQWFLPMVPVPAIAIALIALFTCVNLLGVNWAGRLALPIAAASATLAFLSLLGPIVGGQVDWRQATTFRLDTPFPGLFGRLTSTMAGLYLVGFAAPAFEAAACHVGEMRDPAKNLPRAMYASAGMATLYFVGLPLVWLGTLGEKALTGDLAASLGPTYAPLLGAAGKSAAIGFMMFNMFHGTLAPLTGVARTLSQLSEDGLLPEAFARRNRADCPWVAILVTAASAIAFLFIGDPVWLVAAANFTYLIGIALPSVAVWLLRRDQPDRPRPYRAPRGTISLGLVAAGVWGAATILGFEQFGLPTVILGLALAYSGSVLYVWRLWRDHRRKGERVPLRSIHVKLTGAMLLVLILDGAGYWLAVRSLSGQMSAFVTALQDIFVAVAMLTITVGLVLPGMIAHSVVEVAKAADRLVTGTVADFSRAMNALASGDLDGAHARVDVVPVVVNSRDEIGMLARSFNVLQSEVARAAVGLEGAREGLRTARNELTKSNASLEQRVMERTRELSAAHEKLVDAARRAGMAEVAINVLHNVGNVLNSVNVSASLANQKVSKSRVGNLHKVAALLDEHAADLVGFLTEDERGKTLPAYLGELSAHLEREQREVLGELELLTGNINHIKRIVNAQQASTRTASMAELLDPKALLEEGLRLSVDSVGFRGVQIEKRYEPVPRITADKHRVLQILVNLLANADRALAASPEGERRLFVSLGHRDDQTARVVFKIVDNGVGIPPENLLRIFEHGFTTKPAGGGGYGLHSAALAASLMGGRLAAESGGWGAGATFTLELPVRAAQQADPITSGAQAANGADTEKRA